MPYLMRTALLLLIFAANTLVLAHDGSVHNQPPDRPVIPDSFDALMGIAMARIERDMAVPPGGDPDHDFAAMMIPHHQGAVDMARIQLQFGKDPILRRLAQAIIVEQLQEIDVMQRRLTELTRPMKDPRAEDGLNNNSREH